MANILYQLVKDYPCRDIAIETVEEELQHRLPSERAGYLWFLFRQGYYLDTDKQAFRRV